MGQKITPCLWFDEEAEQAMNYYVEVFNGSPSRKNESKILSIMRYPEGVSDGPMKGMGGKVLTGIFELEGQKFMCLDGGPIFKLTEATSFQVEVDGQDELDYFWGKLSAVPESEQCGWCKDKFGLSWQIIPKQMIAMLTDPNKEKANRAMQAMLKMHKIDIAGLQKAFDGN